MDQLSSKVAMPAEDGKRRTANANVLEDGRAELNEDEEDEEEK